MNTEQSRRLVFGKSQKLSDEKVHATWSKLFALSSGDDAEDPPPRTCSSPLSCKRLGPNALGASSSSAAPESARLCASPPRGALPRDVPTHALTLERIGAMKRTPQEASGLKATCAFCKVKQRRLVSRGRRLGDVTGGLSIGRTGFSVSLQTVRCTGNRASRLGVSGVKSRFHSVCAGFPQRDRVIGRSPQETLTYFLKTLLFIRKKQTIPMMTFLTC